MCGRVCAVVAGAALARVCLNAVAPTVPGDSYIFRGIYTIRGSGSNGLGSLAEDLLIDPRGQAGDSNATDIMAEISSDVNDMLQNTFNFTVKYKVGRGYTFSLTDAEFTTAVGATGVDGDLGTTSKSWNNDNPSGTAGVLNGISPLAYFNTIQIRATATDNTLSTPSSASVTNLQFTPTGATACGTLDSMQAQFSGPDVVNQWLIADADLSETSWLLTGQVELNRAVLGVTSAVQFEVFTAALPDQAFATCGAAAAAC